MTQNDTEQQDTPLTEEQLAADREIRRQTVVQMDAQAEYMLKKKSKNLGAMSDSEYRKWHRTEFGYDPF
jgi:hypothetical protein